MKKIHTANEASSRFRLGVMELEFIVFYLAMPGEAVSTSMNCLQQ